MNVYGVTFDSKRLILDKHDCGLLSNASVTFNGLLQAHKSTPDPIQVVWPHTSVWNKDDREDRNVFELYFKSNQQKQPPKVNPDVYFCCTIGDCGKFDFPHLSTFRDFYFGFSDEVLQTEQRFLTKYNISPEKTIALLYRGTDKILEVPKIHPHFYWNAIQNLPQDYKVLLQTDQIQILRYFQQILGDRLIYIDEMPMTDDDKVMHQQTGICRYVLGLNYLAAVSIMSKCAHVVFDTNNAGLWICILRGSIQNTCQIFAEVKFWKH
jgi:hypothetical protein